VVKKSRTWPLCIMAKAYALPMAYVVDDLKTLKDLRK
jgi:hypothetical protein